MANFQYTALDARGEQKTGSIQAASEAEAIQQLRGQGLYPTQVVEEGKGDTAFDLLERHLPIAVGETKQVDYNYNFHQHFPELDTVHFFSYKGSLTTPPCSENVQWLILTNRLSLSKVQAKVFKDMLPSNNYRKTQPLNGRKIAIDEMVGPKFSKK